MADVFEDRGDLDDKRARLWPLIEATPHLDWLLLTKRPYNIRRFVPWGDRWPMNVWAGTTAENQRWAEKRIPVLLEAPAAVRFVSAEPLLGPLDLRAWLNDEGLKWVIAGGESGPHSRPMNPEWARALRDQCLAAGVSFLFKQWGNWSPTAPERVNGYSSRTMFTSDGDRILVAHLGKKASGRILDGKTWDDVPVPASA